VRRRVRVLGLDSAPRLCAACGGTLLGAVNHLGGYRAFGCPVHGPAYLASVSGPPEQLGRDYAFENRLDAVRRYELEHGGAR